METYEEEANNMMLDIDRRYSNAYELVIKYIIDNNLVLSKLSDEMVYEELIVYGENVFRHANNVANELAKKSIYITMNTVVPHEEFNIIYDSRPIVYFHIIKEHKGVDLLTLIKPMKKKIKYLPTDEIFEIMVLPPEMELIDVYRKLYSPNKDDWKPYYKHENQLFKEFKLRYPVKGSNENIISDLYEIDSNENGEISEIVGGDSEPELFELRKKIVYEYLTDTKNNYVLIGFWAWHVLRKEDQLHDKEKVQIISMNDISVDIKLIGIFMKKYTSYELTYREQDLHQMRDFRVKRYTIYINYPTKDGTLENKPLMDIFNSMTYELIPYHKIDGYLKIGNPFVIMRFMLIDIWVVKIISELGILQKDVMEKKIKEMIQVLDKMRTRYELGFNLEYLGVYIDERISKKNLILEHDFFPYIPEKHKQKHGDYRKI